MRHYNILVHVYLIMSIHRTHKKGELERRVLIIRDYLSCIQALTGQKAIDKFDVGAAKSTKRIHMNILENIGL